ncbi:mercury(II) reductase [Rhodovibrio sodomensis]|uniref:Mercuric reductase n=1 Tax=Rhodovibrio sodomensis TaxID=1088 RepID=A0ABS1DIY2_9PROT|nr:mercury(II) reductase [Rhodovibrio sodomensis]
MSRSSCCEQAGGAFDLVVVGAGSAGFSAAITAAERGARVALIGHGTAGGTCVNVGCVPSKRLIRAVEALHGARTAARFAGVDAGGTLTDWRALVAQKDALVGDLRQTKYLDVLARYPEVSYIEGAARLLPDGVLVDGTDVRADKIVLTTGARPALPDIPGIDDVPVLTSTSALELSELPASMIVVGAGYIGCELAQLFQRAGVQVTLTARRRVLPEAEPEISEALAGYLRAEGIDVRAGVTYRSIARTADGIELALGDGRTEAEAVLVAAGRRPNTENLGLDELGVSQDARGAVPVDDHMRTNRPGVYAAGDVTGRDEFVYMAAHGAKIAALNALDGDQRRYDRLAMPSVVFTDPQVASAGLTDADARATGLEVRSSVLPLEHLPRALAANDTRGLIKLVAEVGTDRLLGAHILAPEGCDSIQTAALAIRQGLTVAELGEMVFPYLTTVEGLKLAAQTFDRDVAALSCCAG